jgi:tRNA modification GTPase
LPSNLDSIAAIATAPGKGGVGVIRISGNNLKSIAISILGKLPEPRHACYSAFKDSEGLIIDRGIAIYFPGPNSYTGEDVLELQAHGGSGVLNLLLKRCLSEEVRLANPGEFTQRAFLNSKLDLAQAESVADLINATSEQAVRSANRTLEGDFSKSINLLVEKLTQLRVFVEATLDFPEDQLDFDDVKQCELKLHDVRGNLENIFKLAQQGSILREGAQVVLVGQPNVGKSSLLNRLSGDEIALVSEVAGTTRDSIRQTITINGVPLHIIDTAGLRESQDVVEQMGIEKTWQVIKKADAVLIVTEIQEENNYEVNKICELIPKSIPRLYVINKIDLVEQKARAESLNNESYVYISVKTDQGIDLLKEKILEIINWQGEEGVFIARERHLQALLQAKQYLNCALDEITRSELMAEELRLAQEALSKITGIFTSDDLLGEIFSHFCIGK